MQTGQSLNIDNPDLIRKLDPSNCLSSIKNFAGQFKSAWEEANTAFRDLKGMKINSLYFCGMGGSAYPGRIIKYLYRKSLPVPLEIVDNYFLPESAGEASLVVCCSYSGDTEETIACANDALKKNIPVVGISSGGKLMKLLKNGMKPFYRFKPDLNPSNQPRLGQGYLLAGVLALFAKLNIISLEDNEVELLINGLEKNNQKLEENFPSDSNSAKQLALHFKNKMLNFVAADFLEGVVHAVRNPINETGKHFAAYSIIPELNHHLLEGLGFPEKIRDILLFIFINSRFYPEKIKKRIEITKDVIKKQKIGIHEIDLSAESMLADSMELIQVLTFASFYLAVIHNVDPAPVPWVDYFKNKLL